MTKQAEARRDRDITRAIHKLFWRGNFENRGTFIVWLFTRPPALFVYNVLIPVQIAYGLQAIIDRQFGAVSGHVWLILLFAAIYSVLWAIGGVAICRNGEIGAVYVQKAIFANYLQKDHEFYSNTYLGALSAQAIRLRESFNEYNQVLVNALPLQLIIIVSSIVVIGYHSRQVALVTLLCMMLVLSFTVASSKWRLSYRRRLSEESSELAGIISDALGQGPTVKSFAAERYEERRLDKAAIRWGRAQYESWMSSIPSDIGRMLLAASTSAVLLLMTAQLYKHATIGIAVVALVQLYVIRLITLTQGIAETIKSYESCMGGAYQAMQTMLLRSTVLDPAAPRKLPGGPSVVAFRNVTYRYPDGSGRKAAVSRFTLTVQPGEKIGLVGYSGSGKTTLTKLLMRFMDVHTGAITIDGIDLREVRQHDVRSTIAYVPQEPLLFHRSVAENISYGRPGASQKEVRAAARMAYVDEFVSDLPKQYNTIVGERGVKLSGGQRQRVAIARALLKDAPILILDEATSALDSRSEKLIQQALWQLMKDRTALVVAHRLSTIQRMDRIVVMDKGRIVQVGTHEELLKQKQGIYAELWAHQSGGYVGIPTKPENEESL